MAINSPTDISDCDLWLRGDGITGLSDGDPVSTWPDESARGDDQTSSGTARPVYKASAGPNSKPVVRFDGVDDLMEGAVNYHPAGGKMTIFAVLGTFASLQGDNVVVTNDDSIQSTNGFQFAYHSTASNKHRNRIGGDQLGSTTTYADSAWHIVAAGTHEWIRQDGVEIASAAQSLASNDLNPLGIGSPIGGNTDTYTEDMAEVIVYGRELSASEVEEVECYLSDKYGISVPHSCPTNITRALTSIAATATVGPLGVSRSASVDPIASLMQVGPMGVAWGRVLAPIPFEAQPGPLAIIRQAGMDPIAAPLTMGPLSGAWKSTLAPIAALMQVGPLGVTRQAQLASIASLMQLGEIIGRLGPFRSGLQLVVPPLPVAERADEAEVRRILQEFMEEASGVVAQLDERLSELE